MRTAPPDLPPTAEQAWTPGARTGEQMTALIEITRLEHVIAAAQGTQARLMVDLVTSIGEAIPDHIAQRSPHLLGEVVDSAYAEVSLALGVAPQTAKKRIDTAVFLAQYLPDVFDAWGTGDLSAAQARAFAEESQGASLDALAALQKKVLPKAGGLPGSSRPATGPAAGPAADAEPNAATSTTASPTPTARPPAATSNVCAATTTASSTCPAGTPNSTPPTPPSPSPPPAGTSSGHDHRIRQGPNHPPSTSRRTKNLTFSQSAQDR